MVHINIDNLKRTDRSLTWLPEPTCDRCSLPFTNHADELYNRLPLLLSCKHLLCGMCVREHAQSDSIVCERCNKRVPFPDDCDNVADALHPSYYMLGMMFQMQQELKYLGLYYGDESKKVKQARNAAPLNEKVQTLPIESLSTRDISTTKKMKRLLEEAFDSYEKTSHTLHKRAKSYPEKVDHVVQKINAHFLVLHNALQMEQDRALQLVRKTYLEQQQRIEQQQQHLTASRKRLKELHTRLKTFHGKSLCSDDRSWLLFSEDVKLFLVREPLKLSTVGGGSSGVQLVEFHAQNVKVFETLSASYKLNVSNLSKMEQLVPFAASDKHDIADAAVAVNKASDTNLPTYSAREKSDHNKHHEHTVRKTGSAIEQPDNVPSHSTLERKLSIRNRHHHEPVARSIIFEEQSMPTRESKHAEESARHCTDSQKDRARGKKRFKTSSKQHERRVLKASEIDTLKRCFWMATITCVVGPTEIYVRDELYDCAAEKIVELCQVEAEDYEAKLLSEPRILNIELGAVYLVQPKNSTDWYRAVVLNLLNPTPEQRGPYEVRYLDYGNTDVVEHDQMRPISEELGEIESQAIRCALYNIVPRDRTATSCPEECYQLMMDFVGNRKVLLYELDDSSDQRVVDLFLPPINKTKSPTASDTKIDVMRWDGYYPPMSMRTMLINLQQCYQKVSTVRDSQINDRLVLLKYWLSLANAQAQQRCTIPRAPVLAEFDFFDVYITHSKSPDHFYIMPMEWKKGIFDQLQEELNALCQEANAYKVFCPYEGIVCGFALDTQDRDRVWLRGRIEKIEPGICWMYALDTGESMQVSCNDLYLFPPGSSPLSVHPLAVCCGLEHIRPKSATSTWDEDAIDEFNMLMKSKTLRFAVTIGPLWSETKCMYSVLLYLRNKSDVDTCVNKLLVTQGHAECILGREAQISDLLNKPDITKISVAPAAAASATPESPKKVIDPRVPVDVLRVISPIEIYVRLSSRKADLDGLHQTIQHHMEEALDGDVDSTDNCSTGKSGWATGDMCLVFTSPFKPNNTEWYRARITEVQEEGELYEAFLIDLALTVQVHQTNVARMVPRIVQLQPGAVRCQLACIEPLRGTSGWQKVTVDELNTIIDSYDKHAISLDAKRPKSEESAAPNPKESLSVVLWGVRVLERQALAPQKTEYRNINQLLVVRGLAHSSGRFRMFATKGEGALEELQSVEEAIEKMMRCEYEKLQQFFREIAAVSAEAEGFGAQEDDNEKAQGALNGEGAQARVEIDSACAIMLSLVDDTGEPITDWPMGDQIEKTVFVGTPTHIGNDGTVFLYDMCQEPVLHRIRNTIREYIEKRSLSSPATPEAFKPGEPCLAKYHLDEMFYRGTVVAVIKRNKYRVLFIDYGNEEICRGEDLSKDIVCGRVPVQTNRFRLSEIVPKQLCKMTGLWPEDAIMKCHGLIVQQLCQVSVNTLIWSPNYNEEAKIRHPIPCKLFRLNDSVDVVEALLGFGNFKRVVEKVEQSVEGPSSTDGRVSKRYRKIKYPMTDAGPGRCNSPPSYTPEQRDLLQFLEEMDSSYEQIRIQKDFEDPNELPDEADDESSGLNRVQLLKVDTADHCDTSYDSSSSSKNSLMSLASFTPYELDSSTQFSPNELDVSPNTFISPISPNRKSGFFANFTNYGSNLTLHIYPQVEGHSVRTEYLETKVQHVANSQSGMLQWQASLTEVGQPCLAPYVNDGRYYRAVVEKVHEEHAEVTVLFVDHLNRSTVAIADLRKCSKELRTIPLRLAEVRLNGVRRNPRIRDEDIGRRLKEVLAQSFFVRIVPCTNPPQPGETFIPEVQLFSDYERGVLAYQRMFDEKFLYPTNP
ncbi:uncharacterized protein LOC128708339 [Anopheles marshallii]|uniref:uncharacterized protein LOC128708339 n=1 Tax=Anopheles marshallii TaxID=1521116 RepID=UPI00237C38AA|nr:uncharacterized protein LOC128708339 [Anopheles marshallii]